MASSGGRSSRVTEGIVLCQREAVWIGGRGEPSYALLARETAAVRIGGSCDDAARVRYVRLYTGGDGQARFEDLEFTLASTEFAPPAPPVNVSEPLDASTFMVLHRRRGGLTRSIPHPHANS
jgi:hypothetical protein